MQNIRFRKGNFFNQLTNQIESQIIDGNQYDLEVSINDTTSFYRVRVFDRKFVAEPIKLSESDFESPKAQYNCAINEITSFLKTDFYKTDFEHRREFDILRKKASAKDEFAQPDFYNFLKRVNGRNLMNGQTLSDYRIPANERRKKLGIQSYDITVESARNYYNIVFCKENVASGFTERNTILYNTYLRKEIKKLNKNLKT